MSRSDINKFRSGTLLRFLVAVALIVAAGVINFTMSHGKDVPMVRPLMDYPLKLGDWKGKSQYLDQKALDILKVDDYFMRSYEGKDDTVGFYVGFFKSQRDGQIVHSPKHCLPGAGWRPVSSERVALDIRGIADPIEVNMLVTQQGESYQLVIYWYQVGKTYVASEYMQKVALVKSAIVDGRTDGSLIRVIVPFDKADKREALKTVTAFLDEAMPLLREYLPE